MSVAEKSYVDFAGLTISPLSPTIGAEVSGVDMGQALSNDQRATLYQAMLDWKVLFFRDQDVSREEHIAFARNFGELEVHPFAPHAEGYREILAIGHDGEHPGRENLWHSDVTWRLQPSLGSILRCQEGPDLGGDTLFSDMYAAYEGLPAEVRDKIDGLVAVHDFPGFRANLRKRGVDEEQIAAFIEEYPNPEHPVVRTHPDTGRNTIYVNGAFTQRIVGMDEDESARLLKYLYSQAAVPEYQCRFRWRQNSVMSSRVSRSGTSQRLMTSPPAPA